MDKEAWVKGRLSSLFPLKEIAYSKLLISRNQSLPIKELYEAILKFPDGHDTKEVVIDKIDSYSFGFTDANVFSSRLSSFVDLKIEEMTEELRNDGAFRVEEGIVSIRNAPLMDLDLTSKVFQELSAESVVDTKYLVSMYHKTPFRPSQTSSYAQSQDWLNFSASPDPSFVLLSLFCRQKTKTMDLLDFLTLRDTLTASIQEKPVTLAALLPNIAEILPKCHFARISNTMITLEPPVIYSIDGKPVLCPYKSSSTFVYRLSRGVVDKIQVPRLSSKQNYDALIQQISGTSVMVEKCCYSFRSLHQQLLADAEFLYVDFFEYITAEYCLEMNIPSVTVEDQRMLTQVSQEFLKQNADFVGQRKYGMESPSVDVENFMFDQITETWSRDHPRYAQMFDNFSMRMGGITEAYKFKKT